MQLVTVLKVIFIPCNFYYEFINILPTLLLFCLFTFYFFVFVWPRKHIQWVILRWIFCLSKLSKTFYKINPMIFQKSKKQLRFPKNGGNLFFFRFTYTTCGWIFSQIERDQVLTLSHLPWNGSYVYCNNSLAAHIVNVIHSDNFYTK